MEIKDLIIALMAFAAFGLVIFGFVANLYSPDNLNVQLDNETGAQFQKLYSRVNSTRQNTDIFISDFQTYVPGGTNASIDDPNLDTADLLRASLKALTQIPRTLPIFSSIVLTVSESLGIDATITGFLIGILFVTIIIILVTAVLKWNSS